MVNKGIRVSFWVSRQLLLFQTTEHEDNISRTNTHEHELNPIFPFVEFLLYKLHKGTSFITQHEQCNMGQKVMLVQVLM